MEFRIKLASNKTKSNYKPEVNNHKEIREDNFSKGDINFWHKFKAKEILIGKTDNDLKAKMMIYIL